MPTLQCLFLKEIKGAKVYISGWIAKASLMIDLIQSDGIRGLISKGEQVKIDLKCMASYFWYLFYYPLMISLPSTHNWSLKYQIAKNGAKLAWFYGQKWSKYVANLTIKSVSNKIY